MTSLSVYFYGEPGDGLDKAARAIFEAHGGLHLGSGTLVIGPTAGERDVQYDVPEARADACRRALKRAGFRFEPAVPE